MNAKKLTKILLGTTLLMTSAIAYKAIAQEEPRTAGIEKKDDKSYSETYKYLNLFGDVFERVRAQYVEEVADKELIEYAVNGMLSSLDPHSSYLNEERYNEMKVETRGQFGGLGIEVTMENGLVKVVTPIDDTPAFRAGIQSGDYIVKIDGEAVILNDDGRPDFQRMQKRAQLSEAREIEKASRVEAVTFYAFDLLAFDGFDIRKLPLLERKNALRELLPPIGSLRFADHVEGAGEALFSQIEKVGLEGVVAKKKDSPYQGGRSPNWLKIRIQRSDDFVIVGFTKPGGSRSGWSG